jgi:two-component system sensor histidine kinase YesM
VRVERATSGTLLGAIVRMNDIVESLRGLSAMEQWEIVLLDKQAQPLTLTSMPNETISAINAKLLQNPSHYQVFKNPSDGNKHLLVSMPFAQVPINLAVLIPEKNLLRQLPFFQIVIYLIPVVVGVVIAMYSVFLKKVLINPMNALIKGMRKVMKGDMEIRVPEAKTEELGFLIDTFNNMISQMRHLKISVYEEMLKAQQAEFKHLQAQINPHFYLNSLNVIYSLSLLEENELIRKMTEHLADYFRFITRSHRDTVWLEEETMHIRNYLEIQSLRFPEKLTYRIDVEESLRTHTILPLTIQPFVENAVIHGMEEGDVPFHIEIKVRTFSGDPRYFEVTIQDNGKGFDPNVLMQFNNKHFGDGTNAHMGIWNVFRRLRMTFGDRIEMKFMNRTPKGALVHLLIPMSDGEA